MANYKVIGGMKGAYMPSYDSGTVDSKSRARNILNEKKQEFKEDPHYEVINETDTSFEVDRGSPTKINYRYRLTEVEVPR